MPGTVTKLPRVNSNVHDSNIRGLSQLLTDAGKNVSIPTLNVLENQKCIVVITFFPASVSNCESPRMLESCTLEFTRGNFVPAVPGMANPMIQAGDMIVGWTSGTPIRLSAGLTNQVLTIIGGVPSWQSPPAGMQNPMVANADLIIGGAAGAPARFPVGANGHVLTVSGGGLTWQSPAVSVNPSVNMVDFIVSADQPTPPVGHVSLSADATNGVGLTIADPTGSFTRLGDMGGGFVGVQFEGAGAEWFDVTSDGTEAWVGTKISQPIRLYSNDLTVMTIRPDGVTELNQGGIKFAQLPTVPTGVGSTYLYGRNDKRLYYINDTGIERPVDPVTTRGDLVIGSSAGVAERVGIGSSGQILTVSGLDVVWADPVGAHPMVATGDIIYGEASGVPTRLPVGTTGFVLTVVGGKPAWVTPSGMTNPMTQAGDIIFGGAVGLPTRLNIGAEGRYLSVSGGSPVWAVVPGFANPMTGVGDLIRGGTAGDPTRLAPGTNGHFLSLTGGIPTWTAAPGFANPMTTASDIIMGGASGVPTRLAKGTDTHVLTVTGGNVGWAAPSGGMTNPMTTPADIIVGGSAGAPTRLGIGANTQVLTVVAGVPTWQAPASGGMTNPMTTAGDIIVGGASGAANRLAKGADTQVLTLVAGTPAWQAPASGGMTNPMTGVGDLIRGGASGAATRLAPGTNGHILTLSSGIPAWLANAAMTNPMTTVEDIIKGGASGTPARVAKGTDGQILKVTAGVVGWAAETGFTNPMTTLGDVITGGASGAPGRLAIGTTGQVLTVTGGVPAWAVNAAMTNPMTTVGDIIRGGTSGAPTRLAKGTDGQFLSLVSGIPAWVTGLTNPMTTGGDIIVGAASGVPARLGIGSNGFVLTVVAGTPSWQVSTGLTNPMTGIGDMIVGGSAGAPTRLGAYLVSGAFLATGPSGPFWTTSPVVGNSLTISNITQGSVMFAGASGLVSQDNTNLFWDDTNNNLRLFGGTAGTSAQRVLALGLAAKPTSNPADTVQLGVVDWEGGPSASFCIYSEAGYSTTIGGGSANGGLLMTNGTVDLWLGLTAGGSTTLRTNTNHILSLGTNATERWHVLTSGHFQPAAHNLYDIGVDGLSEVRRIFTTDYIRCYNGASTTIIYPGTVTFSQSGANTHQWFYSGTVFGLYDIVQGWNIYFDQSHNCVIRCAGGAAARSIGHTAPDTAGAGWRYMLIQN